MSQKRSRLSFRYVNLEMGKLSVSFIANLKKTFPKKFKFMAFTPSKKLTNCDFHISIDNEHFVRDEGDKFSRSNFG